MKDVMLLTGAGQIGMTIARRIGCGKEIALGDKSLVNTQTVAKTMNDAGFDVLPISTDISSRESILAMIADGQKHGPIAMAARALSSPGGFSHQRQRHRQLLLWSSMALTVGKDEWI